MFSGLMIWKEFDEMMVLLLFGEFLLVQPLIDRNIDV